MVTRKKMLFQFILTLSFAAVSMLVLGCKRSFDEKILNGGFEIKAPLQNEPAGWYKTVGYSKLRSLSAEDKVTFAWDSIEHHSGSRSVSIALDSIITKESFHYSWTRNFDDFVIGKEYKLSGWIKTKKGIVQGKIKVLCINENDKIIGFNFALDSNRKLFRERKDNDWTFVKADFRVPNGTSNVRIMAMHSLPINLGGKVWFDDIKIEEK
jgi:hypothetical protein